MVFTRSLTYVIVKLLIYGAIGVAAIVLASIVLSLASVLLAIALVGFLLWMPIHSLVLGNKFMFRKLFNNAAGSCHAIGVGVGGSCKSIHERVEKNCHGLVQKCRVILPFVIEPICGSLIGCALVWMRSPNAPVEPLAMVIGGLVGAGAGVVVAAFGTRGAGQAEAPNSI